MKATYLFTRKIDKQDYKFYHNDYDEGESWIGKPFGTFMVETPKNALGFTDYVTFDCNNAVVNLGQYLAPWKKRKIIEILQKNGYNPFSKDYMEF